MFSVPKRLDTYKRLPASFSPPSILGAPVKGVDAKFPPSRWLRDTIGPAALQINNDHQRLDQNYAPSVENPSTNPIREYIREKRPIRHSS
jgi:hypothetical protein